MKKIIRFVRFGLPTMTTIFHMAPVANGDKERVRNAIFAFVVAFLSLITAWM